MFKATIYQNDQIVAETVINSDDSFHCLAWAHRMGWDVMESASTSAKLTKNSGEDATLHFEYTGE